MRLYKCCGCGYVFEKPFVERQNMNVGLGAYRDFDVPLCPNCRGDNFEKGGECVVDGCTLYADGEYEICETHKGIIRRKFENIMDEYGTNQWARLEIEEIAEAVLDEW